MGTAMIVITGLGGSTALRSRSEEQVADEVRREHDAMIELSRANQSFSSSVACLAPEA